MKSIGSAMTEYGSSRLLNGDSVAFGSMDSSLTIKILPNGDFEMKYPFVTFVIPCEIRRSVGEAMLLAPHPPKSQP